jgi:probable F420-dependent oxidoreductase
MQFGFNLPVSGDIATPENMARIAVEGEAMGYDYCCVSDHLVMPLNFEAKYPYTDSGEFPARSRGGRHEQLIAAMYAAAKTSRLRIVTSVMVVPHRPAVLTAKLLATIDVLSGGRLTLGIGAGWLREEFEAVGTPPFAERGAVTDEYILACKELWTRENPSFAGRYAAFSDIDFSPKPVQKPHIPIWVGGESGPALRRTAKLADAWYPIGTNPKFLLDTMARLRAGIDRLHRHAREVGRNPSELAVAYRVSSYGMAIKQQTEDGTRRLFSGSPADIAGDLKEFAGLGVIAVDFGFEGPSADTMIANMRRFREEVLARV